MWYYECQVVIRRRLIDGEVPQMHHQLKNPDTGDHSNMLLYFGLMCLAAAGSGLLIAKGKKRED